MATMVIQVIKWLAGSPPPTYQEVGGLATQAFEEGLGFFMNEEKEALYRACLLYLTPLLLAFSRGKGELFEELLQETAARLPEFFEGERWRKVVDEAGLRPALELWFRLWAGREAEVISSGLPEEVVKKVRKLRAKAARGDEEARRRLEELLFEAKPLYYEGWLWEDGSHKWEPETPTWPGKEEEA